MPKSTQISAVDWSYVGCLIDSEGSVTISKHRRKDSGKLEYKGRLTIGMNDPHAIKFMQKLFGGKVRIGKKKIHALTGEEYAPAYIIEYSSFDKLLFILTNVKPYSKVKAEQIQTLCDFLFEKAALDGAPKFRKNGIFNNYYVRLKSLKHKYWVK